MDRLEARVNYLTNYNIVIGHAFQQMEHNLHITVPQFPESPEDNNDEEEADD